MSVTHRTSPITVIDSHTGGEPTRLIMAGGPDLGSENLMAQREKFAREFDHLRAAVVNEPRGSDVIVGALLCTPSKLNYAAAVIFFNNVGYLGMCGHGTIGTLVSLYHAGKIDLGEHKIETPVGVVETVLHDANRVSVRNVPSYRFAKQVAVTVDGLGVVHGDIAWGGNWFFLVDDHQQTLTFDHVNQLTDVSVRIRQALERANIRGKDGAIIDHIELMTASPNAGLDARNYVLCPGLAYDRSPCGTGTSAKLACLHADGKLAIGQTWRQESIIGSVFEGRLLQVGDQLIPEITGTAYVTGEAKLILDPRDAFTHGIVVRR